MRLLLLCGFHPAHNAVSSGPKIVAREIEALEASGWEVVTVSFENEMDRRHLPHGFELPETAGSRIFSLTRKLRLLAALRHPLMPFAASVRPFVAKAYVKELLANTCFDRIEIQAVQAAGILPEKWRIKANVVCQDVLTQSYDRQYEYARGLRRMLAGIERYKVRRWETKILRSYGTITVLNTKDKRLVEILTDRPDIEVRYPQVPGYIDPSERTTECLDPSMMLFWAHMARMENVDAVHYFVRTMMPLILAKCPRARFVVAGIDPPQSVRQLAGDSVTITGYVKDPAHLFRSAAVGVVPLRLGAGIKIKTLEMIACGLPVIATSVGAEGVTADDLLTEVDDPETFAAAVITQLMRANQCATRLSTTVPTQMAG